MPLISGQGLSQAVAELSRRKVRLCHACQLVDLESYLQVGGVPSRNLMETKGLTYTLFDSDNQDRKNGVWNLVFFNLADFGHWFAQGKNTVPNPFGPILLCFDPEVITQAVDVSISLRSAGARDFDRIAEDISADAVPRLFRDAESRHIRFADALREESGCAEAQSPEISCSFRDELAPLSHLAYVIVDEYTFPRGPLVDIVRQRAELRGASRVFQRWCANGHEARYQILLGAILSGARTASELTAVIPDDSPLSNWRDAVLRSAPLSFQFGRYARYLYEGTVKHCI